MTPRERYIRDHAPTMLLIQATRAEPGAKLDLDQAIRLAGALWDRLDAAASDPLPGPPPSRGRGGVGVEGRQKPPKPRATIDHYGALPDAQRAGFDRFYSAYRLPKGKQRAAARWAQIAPDAQLIEHIVSAAAADAAAPRPADAVRKWPEGWLSERRWEDAPGPADTAAAQATDAQRIARTEQAMERRRLERLVKLGLASEADQSALAALGAGG